MASVLRSAFLLSCVTGVTSYGYMTNKAHEDRMAQPPAAISARPSASPIQAISDAIPEQPTGALPICRTGKTIGWVVLPGGEGASKVTDLTNARLFTLASKPGGAAKSPTAPWFGGTKAGAARSYNSDRPAANRSPLPAYASSGSDGRYVNNRTGRSRTNAFSRVMSRSTFRNSFSRELNSTYSRFN